MEEFGSFLIQEGAGSPNRQKQDVNQYQQNENLVTSDLQQSNQEAIQTGSFYIESFDRQAEVSVKHQTQYDDYAQEIESPYNRKKDALIDDSEDEERISGKLQQSDAKSNNKGYLHSLSPVAIKPAISLIQINQNTSGNIQQISQSFFNADISQLRPTDQYLDRIPNQQRHYSEQIFPKKSIRNNLDYDEGFLIKPRGMIEEEQEENEDKQEDIKQIPFASLSNANDVINKDEEIKIKQDSSQQINKNGTMENEVSQVNEGDYNSGKWTDDEHMKFLRGLKLYGKNWNQIQKYIGTRSCPQTRSHAQKFFRKMGKKGLMINESQQDDFQEGEMSEESNESKKKGKPKRQRFLSMVNDTQKLKLLNTDNEIQRLEMEAVQFLNSQVLQKPQLISPTTKSQTVLLNCSLSPNKSQSSSFFKTQVAPQLQSSQTDKMITRQDSLDKSPRSRKNFRSPEVHTKPKKEDETPLKQKEEPQKVQAQGLIGKRKKQLNKIDFDKVVKMQQNQKYKKIFEVKKISPSERQKLKNYYSSSSNDEYCNNDYENNFDQKGVVVDSKFPIDINPNWSQIKLPIKSMIEEIQKKASNNSSSNTGGQQLQQNLVNQTETNIIINLSAVSQQNLQNLANSNSTAQTSQRLPYVYQENNYHNNNTNDNFGSSPNLMDDSISHSPNMMNTSIQQLQQQQMHPEPFQQVGQINNEHHQYMNSFQSFNQQQEQIYQPAHNNQSAYNFEYAMDRQNRQHQIFSNYVPQSFNSSGHHLMQQVSDPFNFSMSGSHLPLQQQFIPIDQSIMINNNYMHTNQIQHVALQPPISNMNLERHHDQEFDNMFGTSQNHLPHHQADL
eukprot:403367570